MIDNDDSIVIADGNYQNENFDHEFWINKDII